MGKENNMTPYIFTKEDTKLLKGGGIILMLAHHLWAFPERLISDLPLTSMTPFGMQIAMYIGWYGKICVSLFMFLGGYGSYLLYKQKKFDYIEKIKSLYLSYWKVFAVFIPIGFLFFQGQSDYSANTAVCHVFDHYSISDFLANLTGIRTSYNGEWWFFFSYVVVLATFPIVVKIIEKGSFGINMWIVCVYEILVTYVFPTFQTDNYFPSLSRSWLYTMLVCQSAPWCASFWCGCVFAKDHMLERLKHNLDKAGLLNSFAALAGILVTFFLRIYVVGEEADIFYVPIICIYGTYLSNRVNVVKRCLLKLGEHSTSMWLIHSFLIYYFYGAAKFILGVRHVLLVLIILILNTYLLSCITNNFYLWIYKVVHSKNLQMKK